MLSLLNIVVLLFTIDTVCYFVAYLVLCFFERRNYGAAAAALVFLFLFNLRQVSYYSNKTYFVYSMYVVS